MDESSGHEGAPRRRRIALSCDEPGCRKPAAFVVLHEGRLQIEVRNRHNGAWHISYLTIDAPSGTLILTAELPHETTSR